MRRLAVGLLGCGVLGAAVLLAGGWPPVGPVAVVVGIAGVLLLVWVVVEATRAALQLVPPYRYVLVREGLLERNLVADAVYPWHRILAFDLGELNGAPVVVLDLLYGPEPDPPFELLPGATPERLRQWTARRVRGYQRTRAWAGTDLLIGARGLREPPAAMVARLREIAVDPGRASALPSAEEAVGLTEG